MLWRLWLLFPLVLRPSRWAWLFLRLARLDGHLFPVSSLVFDAQHVNF